MKFGDLEGVFSRSVGDIEELATVNICDLVSNEGVTIFGKSLQIRLKRKSE